MSNMNVMTTQFPRSTDNEHHSTQRIIVVHHADNELVVGVVLHHAVFTVGCQVCHVRPDEAKRGATQEKNRSWQHAGQ